LAQLPFWINLKASYVASMSFKHLIITAIFCLAIGCATAKVDWQSRIGAYNFDAAVHELGVPDRETTLSDGSRVAEWLTSRGNYYGNTTYFPGSRFQQYDIDKFPDQFIRLTFSAKGNLTKVEKYYK
jgi:hypothetical protein